MSIDDLIAKFFEWDLQVLQKLNVQWSHPILDRFWLTVTHLENWAVVRFGVLPALFIWLIYKYRLQAFKPLVALALVVGATDAISYRFIKKNVERLRPFQNPAISSFVRQVGSAHGSSFPSNHAANCFAAASVLSFYFQRRRRMFYSFAAIVALSRPALGVHYPSDILAGAFLGLLVAWVFRVFVLNRWRLLSWSVHVSNGEEKTSAWRVRSRRLFDS